MFIPRIKPITQKRLAQLQNERNKAAYRQWRKDVLVRDGHKCQYPGCDATKDLEIHHIKKFHNYKHLRTALVNGICLCEKHHDHVTGHESKYELLFFKIAVSNGEKYENKKAKNKDFIRFEGTDPIHF